jgi:hypothetical protein
MKIMIVMLVLKSDEIDVRIVYDIHDPVVFDT